MAMIDYSWLGYFMPFFGFFFVFIIIYAVLLKTEILGDGKFISIFVALIFASIFVAFTPGVEYIGTVIPWFVILFIALFLLLLIIGFSQKDMDKFMKPGLAWVFIGLLAIVFLVAAIRVFNPFIAPYLPGQPDSGGEPFLISIKDFVYSERFLGAVLLIAIAAVVSWVLTKKVKD